MKKQFTYDYMASMPTADVVLFGVDFNAAREKALKVLLIKRCNPKEIEFGKWALPGGFLNCDTEKDLETCAIRELKEETGVTFTHIEQLFTFSKLGRDPRERMGTPKRIITTAHLGITNTLDLGHRPDGVESSEVEWKGVNEVDYAFDHQDIVKTAVERLRGKIRWTPVAFNFLEEEFTLTQARKVFESIEGKDLNPTNFKKFCVDKKNPEKGYKVLETGKIVKQAMGKPARTYYLNITTK